MPVEAACPSCDGKFRLPDAAAGKKIRCPKCKGPLDVPPLTVDVAALIPVAAAVIASAPVTAAPQSEALKTTWRSATQEPAPVEPARVETPKVEVSKPVQQVQPAKSVVIKSPPAVAPAEPQKPVSAPVTAPKPKPAAAVSPAAMLSPIVTVEQWFLRGDDGEPFGPVDRPTLNSWHDEGRMTADSQLLKQGTEQWQWASDLYPDLEEPAEPAATTIPVASSSIHSDVGQESKIRPAAAEATEHDEEADDESRLSPHSKPVAFLLALTLGMFGIHRFYLGYVGIGLAMFFTFGGLLMWSITDALRILFGHVTDAEGLKLRD